MILQMLPLGHMGIGLQLVRPLTADLSKKWVLVGALLPDLIDKPLYYGLTYFPPFDFLQEGVVQGTRTFGHTGLVLFLLTVYAVSKGSSRMIALSLGVASHLFLDVMGDSLELFDQSATVKAILFPFLGLKFNALRPISMGSHLEGSVRTSYVAISEVIGVLLLGYEYLRTRTKPLIK